MSSDRFDDYSKGVIFSYSWRKYLVTFIILVLSGFLYALFRSFGTLINVSGGIISFFTPLLLTFPLIFLGLDLWDQIAAKELKGVRIDWQDLSLKRTLFYAPLMLLPAGLFLAPVICLIIFTLFHKIPYVGEPFAALFAFIPFLAIWIGLILIVLGMGMVFGGPVLFIKKGSLIERCSSFYSELRMNWRPFFKGYIFAFFPLLIMLGLVLTISLLTFSMFISSISFLISFVTHLSLLIPSALLLTPPLALFFHLSLKQMKNS